VNTDHSGERRARREHEQERAADGEPDRGEQESCDPARHGRREPDERRDVDERERRQQRDRDDEGGHHVAGGAPHLRHVAGGLELRLGDDERAHVAPELLEQLRRRPRLVLLPGLVLGRRWGFLVDRLRQRDEESRPGPRPLSAPGQTGRRRRLESSRFRSAAARSMRLSA
jgi:hypothetical protein